MWTADHSILSLKEGMVYGKPVSLLSCQFVNGHLNDDIGAANAQSNRGIVRLKSNQINDGAIT
jgi:hypothetical protein